jgi:hypothetical protein
MVSRVALHFERRVALLVVIPSVGMLDRGRIADAIGEYKACADDERSGGQHDSHDNLSHRPILALVQCVPKPKLSIPRATHAGLRRLVQS